MLLIKLYRLFYLFICHAPHGSRWGNHRETWTDSVIFRASVPVPTPSGAIFLKIDWCIGRIIEELEKPDLAENTVVFFTSDNGPWLTEV